MYLKHCWKHWASSDIKRVYRNYRFRNCNYLKCWAFDDVIHLTFNCIMLRFDPLKTSYRRILPITELWLLLDIPAYIIDFSARPGFKARISGSIPNHHWSIFIVYLTTNTKHIEFILNMSLSDVHFIKKLGILNAK